jgi:hypothetical protein
MHGTTQPKCSCGRQYSTRRWTALPLVTRLVARDLSLLVTPWPANLVVEARKCRGCHQVISRLFEQEPPDRKNAERQSRMEACGI